MDSWAGVELWSTVATKDMHLSALRTGLALEKLHGPTVNQLVKVSTAKKCIIIAQLLLR